DLGQVAPDFVGGEGEDGGYEADEYFGDFPDDRLGGAALDAGGREGVHAVLEHVEVERAEVHDGEFIDGVEDAVELEALVPVADLFRQLAGAGEHVAIEREELVVGDLMLGGVEAVEVAEKEFEGVAELAIVFRGALHEVVAGGDVFAEVNAGSPDTDDLCAEFVSYGYGIDSVAEGFGEGAALLVEGPADGGYRFVGRGTFDGHGAEQGGVEPAAVLVGSFDVEVGGPAKLRVGLENGVPAYAGVEPDVEDVHFLAESGE